MSAETIGMSRLAADGMHQRRTWPGRMTQASHKHTFRNILDIALVTEASVSVDLARCNGGYHHGRGRWGIAPYWVNFHVGEFASLSTILVQPREPSGIVVKAEYEVGGDRSRGGRGRASVGNRVEEPWWVGRPVGPKDIPDNRSSRGGVDAEAKTGTRGQARQSKQPKMIVYLYRRKWLEFGTVAVRAGSDGARW